MDAEMPCHHNMAVVVVVVMDMIELVAAVTTDLLVPNIVPTREVTTIAVTIGVNESGKDRAVVAIAAVIVASEMANTRSQLQATVVAGPGQEQSAPGIEASQMSMNRPYSMAENMRDHAHHRTDLGPDLDQSQSPGSILIHL